MHPTHPLALTTATAFLVALSGCFGMGVGIQGDDAAAIDPLLEWGPAIPPGTYDFSGTFARVATPGIHKELPLVKNLLASAVDGAAIEIGYWLPDVPPGAKVPVIVDAGPYYGNDGGRMEEREGHLGRLVENFVQHGYAVAGVSVRGTGASGGCMDLMGPDEVADLSAAITWLGSQPWSNGNVGMVGKSYDGSTPWMVASTGNPYLKTIVPVSGVPDVYELMFRNGTSEIRGPLLLNALYYNYAVRLWAPPAEAAEVQRWVGNTQEGLTCPDQITGLRAALNGGLTGERDASGYWQARNLKPRVEENYRGSILLVQGLQDWNVDPALSIPWGDALNQSGRPLYQVLGQWGHSHPDDSDSPPTNQNMRWDWGELLLRWFNRWLKEDATIQLGPPVQLLTDERQWRYDASFPPRDATWTTYHLSEGGKLAAAPGARGSAALAPQAVGNPLRGEIADDVDIPRVEFPDTPMRSADFVLPTQEEDLRISGLPKVHVTVTPDGPGGYLAAYLYDVDEGGVRDPIGWTMMNLRFHEGGSEAKDVQAGETIVARMEIEPLEAVIEKGHHLMLRIWVHRDEANGDTAQGRAPGVPPTPVTLEYGGDVWSVLELPTVVRGPEYFIEPPYPAD